MMKIVLTVLTTVLVFAISPAQTLQSPDQFLGYKVGTKFTRMARVDEYFGSVAKAMPGIVKLEKYGETNEGRELMLAFISSPENMQRLDAIRKNNLRLAGLANDKAAAITESAPAIVWLSYNVHGNEASSSEASMMTLYALTDPNNQQAKEWLKNTVVIIDPCMNPDGRDRYVNWFNSMTGKNFNTDPQSREHGEPWPGGRSNHYNFDLNRDWVWQTQIESQLRMNKYNEWMPQVHVDFHEQGVNEPYYFAPAAEPFHEVITPWQREFQTMIGKNNAKYFDDNGWLYFTKELFDLFYPSYGDTYPTYNGAIGMTFEQGGGARGGLAAINEDGDTLTLVDRATHHFTTGISTIETTSKNAQKVINEYKKFFDDNRNAKNAEYKTYVVTSGDRNKIDAVKMLLDKNGIESGPISGKVKGYRYFTNKEEETDLDKYSLAVSMYQPKSSLARVLFEPQSKLNDSVTYDITAWSIPYAYGVEGYALKEKREVVPPKPMASNIISDTALVSSTYGYLLPYHSLNSAKALAFLLKNGVKVRYAAKPFTYNGQNFDRGTLIILKTANNTSKWNLLVNQAASRFNTGMVVVTTGMMDKGADFGSSDVHIINAPKIAVLTGEGVASTDAGEIWDLFDNTLGYPVSMLNANDLTRANLKNYNVLIMPDGSYRSLNDKAVSDKLKDFVRTGGKLIALQGAVSQLASGDWGIKAKEDKPEKAEDKVEYANLKSYADRQRDRIPNSIAGAIYKVQLDSTHPLAFGYPGYYYTLKQDGGVYEFLKEGWNVGILKKDNYVAGFSGFKLKNKLKDGVLFGVNDMGGGSFVFFADNPLFRMFWENGKLMFCNAVFLVGQ